MFELKLQFFSSIKFKILKNSEQLLIDDEKIICFIKKLILSNFDKGNFNEKSKPREIKKNCFLRSKLSTFKFAVINHNS